MWLLTSTSRSEMLPRDVLRSSANQRTTESVRECSQPQNMRSSIPVPPSLLLSLLYLHPRPVSSLPLHLFTLADPFSFRLPCTHLFFSLHSPTSPSNPTNTPLPSPSLAPICSPSLLPSPYLTPSPSLLPRLTLRRLLVQLLQSLLLQLVHSFLLSLSRRVRFLQLCEWTDQQPMRTAFCSCQWTEQQPITKRLRAA